MQYILFDAAESASLYPFTATRAVATITCGAMTMQERWNYYLKSESQILTNANLQKLYEVKSNNSDVMYINANVFANASLANAIQLLPENTVLKSTNHIVIAARLTLDDNNLSNLYQLVEHCSVELYVDAFKSLQHVWDIFSLNAYAILHDFEVIKSNKQALEFLPNGVQVVGDINLLFIEEGATVSPCIINVQNGPVYIAKGAEIMEGCLIRGPLAILEQGVLKMGAKVYGATTIGKGSKVGGEVNNVVFFNNSNKGHDGFLGNAVIGEWCNLGADTNCSNLKNNYDIVKIWDVQQHKLVSTGLQFCGLLMGDHSKCGINTMFNTGTVVGVSANIFGVPFPPKFIPSFTWGGVESSEKYQLDKAIETANRMMERRHTSLSEAEVKVFQSIFQKDNY